MLSVANRPIMLIVSMPSVANKPIMLSVVLLNVVMLNVVAPLRVLSRVIITAAKRKEQQN